MVRGQSSKHKLPQKGSDWSTVATHSTSARVQPTKETTPNKNTTPHINPRQSGPLHDSNMVAILQRANALVPKTLDQAPDPKLNLYIKGLPPHTTSESLFEKFKPYGNILSCKIIVDFNTGLCKGGFVLFDSQESCKEARRELTQQGLYVNVAHDSVSLSKLHYEQPTPAPEEMKALVPELDDSAAFPGLPRAKTDNRKKFPAQPLPSISTPSSASTLLAPSAKPEPMDLHSGRESEVGSETVNETPPECVPANEAPPSTIHERSLLVNEEEEEEPVANSSFTLGHSFLDFDGGFIGTHQQLMTNEYNLTSEYRRRPSLLDQKTHASLDDVDKYMNAWELSNNAAVAPQISRNNKASQGYSTTPHITSTVLDDFMSEERKHRSPVYFENLPGGFKYLDLFYLFSQYGPLVMSSVDIRDINEQCPRMGIVTFESQRDAEVAVCSLSKEGYRVYHAYTTTYHNEPMIDDQLYHQYYQQHQEMLQLPPEGFGSPLEPDAPSTFPNNGHHGTPPTYHGTEGENPWETSTPEYYQSNGPTRIPPGFEDTYVSGSTGQEKFSMLGISPMAVSLSPSSSVASYAGTTDEATDLLLHATSNGEGSQVVDTECVTSEESEESEESEATNRTVTPVMSYSAIVRAPPKPKPRTTMEDKCNSFPNPPSQDLKRRGNTNKSLDEKEYNLNLFLKDLEPSMDEFKLYDVCVKFGPVMSCRTITTHHGVCTGLGFVMYIHRESVERAIEGMKELGYHAEIAIQSATNKLRCKVRSDTLFLQNIPLHIKENKLRELFRPYHIEHCNVLRDQKTGKGKGVAFLKVKDMNVADRFIEEYHGRILDKDWKLPLQVSPAKEH